MVLVFGDLNVDVIARLASPILLGEDCPSEPFEFHCGGVGANVAFALAALGTPVRMVGCAGADWFGDFLVSGLSEHSIDVRHVRRSNTTMTGMMFIAVALDGQRTIFASRGANLEAPQITDSTWDEVTAVEIAGYAFLHATTAGFAENLLRDARAKNIATALDVGSSPSREIPEVLRRVAGSVDTLFANEDEARAITGASDADDVFAKLQESGCAVVLKRGAEGCQLSIDGRCRKVPPLSARIVDTTGAGDAFTAAFLAARSWKWPNAHCALLANAAGAAAASVVGAGVNMPAVASIRATLESSHFESDWEVVRCDVINRLADRAMSAEKP